MSATQAPVPPSPASPGSFSDAASHSALTALYTAALGHGPPERYLRRFAQFDAAGRTAPSWNGAASLCTLGWASLRHLWVPALLYVAVLEGLALLALGPGRWLLPQPAQLPALLAMAALAWVLPGLYGDALLHTEIRKRIVTALSQTQTVAEACTFLGQRASTAKRLQNLVWAHATGALAIVAAVALYFWQPAGMSANIRPMPAATATGAPQPEPTVQEALVQAAAERADPTPAPEPLLAPAVPAAEPPATPPSAQERAAPPAAPPTTPSKGKSSPTAASAPVPPEKAPTAAAPGASRRSAPPAAAPKPVRADSASKQTTPEEPGKQPGYYLNAGLFAQEANARKVQAQLLNSNLPAFRQTLQTAQGERIRVRIGPFGTQQKAQAQSATLRGMGLEAVVFRQ